MLVFISIATGRFLYTLKFIKWQRLCIEKFSRNFNVCFNFAILTVPKISVDLASGFSVNFLTILLLSNPISKTKHHFAPNCRQVKNLTLGTGTLAVNCAPFVQFVAIGDTGAGTGVYEEAKASQKEAKENQSK